jgi:dihydropyrimidinase
MDLILRNGTVVTATDRVSADVGIEGGLVKQIGLGLAGPAAREIDVTGRYLFPGGVDAHTHVECELLGAHTIDDFYSSTLQAACGGVTTIIDYVLAAPGQPLLEGLEQWNRMARGKTLIDYGLHPVLFKPSERTISEMADVVSEGYTSFKIFMPGIADFDILVDRYYAAMAQAGRLGALINIHCEDQACISHATMQLDRDGHRSSIRHYPDSRPRLAEGMAAKRAIQLAGAAEAPIYMVHLSCEEALDAINDARAHGQTVYGETRPIYLHLSRERFEEKVDPERYVGWPPLREADQMEVLWQALDASVLQTVATDHIGWTLEQKKSRPKVDELIPGMANLETVLPMLYSEGVGKGRLSLNRFVAVSSTNPAKLFGLYPKKGTIAVGSDADIVVFDPNKRVTIQHENMHSQQDWELHEGFEVTGWPEMTLSRGEIIVENGKVLAEPGRGQLVKRKRFAEIQNIDNVR